MTDPILTAAQLAEVQAYYAPYYAIGKVRPFVDFAIAALVLRYLIRPGWRMSESVAQWLADRFGRLRTLPVSRAFFRVIDLLWSGPGWGTAFVFAIAYVAFEMVQELPLTIWLGYFHEHAYGMSNYTPGKWLYDMLKTTAVTSLAFGALAFGLCGLMRKLKYWWVVMGVILAIAMPVSGALDAYRAKLLFDQNPLPEGPLRTQIVALMKEAGVDFQDLVVEKTSRATKRSNAYFAGRGPTRRIVLTDTLVDQMQPDEVLAVVAHEAGHTREAKWPGEVASVLAMFAFLFVIDWLLRLSYRRGWFGVTEVADIRALPLVFTVFSIINLIASPITAYYSREREREADRFALALTKNPEAFQRMLKALCVANKEDPDPPAWRVIKGKSHPPIRERFEAAGGPKRL